MVRVAASDPQRTLVAPAQLRQLAKQGDDSSGLPSAQELSFSQLNYGDIARTPDDKTEAIAVLP